MKSISIFLFLALCAVFAHGQFMQIGIPDSAQNVAHPGSTGAYTITNPLGNNGTAFNNPPITVSCVNNCQSDWVYFYRAGLAVPPNATITGIELIHSRGGCNQGAYRIDTLQLAFAGGRIGNVKRDSASAQVTDTLGSSGDLWGAALTPAIVNDPSFGVMVRSSGPGICTFGQFEARLVVHYCAGSNAILGIPDSVASMPRPGSTGAYSVTNPLNHNGTSFSNGPVTMNCFQNCRADDLYFYDLGMQVPTGVSITGIEVQHAHSGCNGGAYVIDSLWLAHQGQALGTSKRDSSDNIATPFQHGGPFDLWGAALTPAMVNDPSFGVMVRSTGTGICTHGQWDLRVTVFYGCATATAVTAAVERPHMRVAPNPTRDRVQLIGVGSVRTVQVLNALGQAQAAVWDGNSVDLSGLPGGTYCIVAQLPDGRAATAKVVKE